MTQVVYEDTRENAEENVLRAQQWSFLARILASPPNSEMLMGLSQLDGDDTALGQAYCVLAKTARDASADDVANEFFELFVGVGRGELLPYASFYITGFLNERPLADLRRDLSVMGIERAKDRFEPEDHIASLAEVMAGLASGEYDAAPLGCGGAGEAGFFARHLEPWVTQFFDDLAVSPSAEFYRAVAEIGRTFTDVEMRAFELARKEAAGSPRGAA